MLKVINEILVTAETINSQCTEKPDLYIYLDYVKQNVEMYCAMIEDEQRIKYNFVKIAKKYGFVTSDKEFWKRILDITIKENKDKTLNDHYIVRYELKEK